LSTYASSSSTCGTTSASSLSVSVSNSSCVDCSASTSCGGLSGGANSYGGSMSIIYVGAYAWSFSNGGGRLSSISFCNSTHMELLSVSVASSSYHDSKSISRKRVANCLLLP
jgi:hypothetical protein